MLLTSVQAVSAQDLLARQAPVDRKAKAVDTLALQRLIEKEVDAIPAYDIYQDWGDAFTPTTNGMPDTYKIDLRGFCMPTPSRAITSNFGPRWGRMHKGLDIKVYVGDTIRAAFNGKVRIVRYEAKGFGNYIVIRHGNGLETIYGHLSKQLVRENQIVRAGDVIGLGGNTGRSTGSHLHFETRLAGVAINPALMFDFRAQDVVADYYTYNKSTYNQESAQATRLRGVIGSGGYTPDEVKGSGVAMSTHNSSNNSNAMLPNENGQEKLYHKVADGESLESIAKKRGVSVDTICRLNNLKKNSKIRMGQILRYS